MATTYPDFFFNVNLDPNYSKRVTQSRFEGRTTVAPIASHTQTGEAFNTPGQSIPTSHQMVIRIRHVEIPLFI